MDHNRQQNDERGFCRKDKRPPGLRGREIGFFYRNRARQRLQQRGAGEKEKKIRLGPRVDIPPQVLALVSENLQKFIEAPECQPDANNEKFIKHFRHLLNVDFLSFINEVKSTNEEFQLKNPTLDEHLKQYHIEKKSNEVYASRYKKRQKLPTMKYAEEILQTVRENQVVLIVGSTGCGKTTQVPQILLDACIESGTGSECRVICTQPRRISAITVAERVAYERNEPLGVSVGYQIRLESKKPRYRGSIVFCTTGVLLTQLQTDPLMHDVSVLILDEIHERSVETDLLMGLLKIILPHRPELKVLLMSATVREQEFCDYFDKCPMFRIEGVAFPVQMLYLEDVIQETRFVKFKETKKGNNGSKGRFNMNDHYSSMIQPYLRGLRGRYDERVLNALQSPESEGCQNIAFIEHLIYHICANKPDGAILVFVPGYDKISKLTTALTTPTSPLAQLWSNQIIVYPLHSIMPTAEQQAIFKHPPAGKRKVIISTILAETSVTIDDVVYVINTGRTKITNYDIESNIQSLDEVWVTKANTQQRKGRAGRVQPGICYNLFTRARENLMLDMPKPQILCSRLESIILSLKVLHIADPYQFLLTLIDPPKPEAIRNGIVLLKRIEALDQNEVLTPLGTHLAKLPIEPQMGKMILMSALFRCLDPITSAAAALSYKSPFYTPLNLEKRVDSIKGAFDKGMHSDHLMIHSTISKYRKAVANYNERNFCYDNFLSVLTMKQLERMKQQFAEIMYQTKFLDNSQVRHGESNTNSNNMTLLRAIIAAGLCPNMAHVRKSRLSKHNVQAVHHLYTDDDVRVHFHPSSVNSGATSFDSNFFVYFQKQKSAALYLFDSTMVLPMALLVFGDCVESGVTPNNERYITVGKTFYFKCDEDTSNMIFKLRFHLENLLLKKALYPAPITSDEQHIIKALEILLSLDISFAYDQEADQSSRESDDCDD